MKIVTIAFALVFLSPLANGTELESPYPHSGSFLYRFLGLYPLFKADLYAPDNYGEPIFSPSKPLDLDFTYYRFFTSEQLIKQANRSLQSGKKTSSIKRFSEELSQLNSSYQDVDQDDHYRLSYRPKTGTTLYLNGEALTNIQGEGFPVFYFSIWLGSESDSSKMSKSLWKGVDENY